MTHPSLFLKYKVISKTKFQNPLEIPESGDSFPFGFGEINGEQVGDVNIFIHGPCQFNPHHEVAKENMESWIIKHKLFAEKESQAKFFKGNYAALMAYTYPDANAEGLSVASYFGAWLFVHDDFRDRKGIPIATIQRMNNELYKVLDSETFTPNPSDEFYPIVSSFKDLLEQCKAFGDTKYLKNEMRTYLEKNIWEAENREKKVISSLFEYTRNRRYTSAVEAAFEMGYLINGITISADERGGADFKSSSESGCHAVCFGNDIVSLKKEIGEEIAENLVIVAKYNSKLPMKWKESIEDCHDNHYHSEVKSFIKNRKGNRYEKVIDDWIKGSMVWSLPDFPWGTPRYASWKNKKVTESYSRWGRT